MSEETELAQQINLAARAIAHTIVGSETGLALVAADAQKLGMKSVVYDEKEEGHDVF